MHRIVTLTLEEAAPPGALLLAPRPFGHWGQRLDDFAATGIAGDPGEVEAENSRQRAFALTPLEPGPVRLRYTVAIDPGLDAPDWVWQVQRNRLTTADPGLADMARDLCAEARAAAPSAIIRTIAERAATLFDYDHPQERFNDGHDAVPALCGTTRGSCVDINTFILAAARSQGLTGQHVSGYWFGPGRLRTPDGHCWLAVQTEAAPASAPEFWDVAHHLKWGVEGFGPGLDPAGGRRIAMSCGRGLRFATANGTAEIGHFSVPHWVMPGGGTNPSTPRIELEETTS